MGHSINYSVYDEKVNRKEVQSDWNEMAYREGDGCGLPNDIRWLDRVSPLNSREEAENYISRQDSGWYDQLAVRFIERSFKPNKKIEDLKVKANDCYSKLREAENKKHYEDAKCTLVTCKKCGSKLNREMLVNRVRTNRCPLCGEDLRPDTTLNRIKKMRENYEKIQSQIKAEENRLKSKDKGKVKWLVKVEYHV